MPRHPNKPSDGHVGRVALSRRIAFWTSLLLVILAIAEGYRYHPATPGLCIHSLEESAGPAGAAKSVALPLSREPQRGTQPFRTLRYRFTFNHDAGTREPEAISIGEALPFYRLVVNGANVTPEIDLSASDIRDMAPHLHLLPDDVLKPGTNVAELELPIAYDLGEVRIDQLCVGSRAQLEPAFRANWWRMVAIPQMIAMLFCVLIVLAIALWLLAARQPAYAWYIVCLLLLLVRVVYVSTSARPGTPLLWMLTGDILMIPLPYALYRFTSAYWQFSRPWLARLMIVMASGALISSISYLVPQAGLQRLADAFVVLILVSSDLLVVGAMASQLHALHWIEKGVVVWVGIVAFFCIALEIANIFQPLSLRWMWPAPPANALLAIGFGYLLVRRMALGADVFAYATDTLADDLDHALDPRATTDAGGWADVSASITRRERSRMMRDIHDGFGSRLVAVLNQARRELPSSPLHRQIQRALLDMRLMLDAMDDASRSLVLALARLRHRIEPTLAAADIASEWQTDAIDGVSIDSRRKLIAVFRCLEELIDNSLQHSRAKRVSVAVGICGDWLEFSVEDDGCGMGDAAVGRGLERSRLWIEAMHGSLHKDARGAGCGTRFTLRVPLF
jgi:signal transduction histidine kinase